MSLIIIGYDKQMKCNRKKCNGVMIEITGDIMCDKCLASIKEENEKHKKDMEKVKREL